MLQRRSGRELCRLNCFRVFFVIVFNTHLCLYDIRSNFGQSAGGSPVGGRWAEEHYSNTNKTSSRNLAPKWHHWRRCQHNSTAESIISANLRMSSLGKARTTDAPSLVSYVCSTCHRPHERYRLYCQHSCKPLLSSAQGQYV